MRQYFWTILVVAGVFEAGFSIGLKYSEGFTRLWPSVATAIMIVLSLGLVGVATWSSLDRSGDLGARLWEHHLEVF
jgi:quaternary ammonium compound-resistance protein SugE